MRFVPSRSLRLIFVSFSWLVLATFPALAQVRVGETVPLQLDSARNYRGAAGDGPELVWSERLQRPGATYLALHFVDFDLAAGDYLVVSDDAGRQAYRLTGRGKQQAGTFWARHVKGDTVRLELWAGGPGGGPGFVIDEIAAGNVALAPRAFEAICGVDDMENAICYRSTHATEYERSRAVARLLINGVTLCTGWLVSSSGDVLTNEHCISTALHALNTDFEFMAEAPGCADANCELCHPGAIYSGSTFIRDNRELDYALVRVDGGNPATTYGYLEIDDRPAVVGETIYIPQHPGGRAKELAIFSSESVAPGSRCTVTTTTATACFGGDAYHDVGYLCDTEGGSSGAPVLAASSHKVIALHHCSNCPNRAVPIQLIHAEIAGLLGPQCAVAADCDDGLYCNGAELCVNQVCLNGLPPCGFGNGCDEPSDSCVDVCDEDGVCEADEDCNNCSSDCVSGVVANGRCGNGECEIGSGENCFNCPEDCNGRSNGPLSRRFCCGAGVGCDDPRCTEKRERCSQSLVAGTEYCCGDGTCSPGEDNERCAVDCPTPSGPCDGDGICEGDEDCVSCPVDCEGRLGGRQTDRYCCGNGVFEFPENPLLCDGNF